jgi:malate/lactate dehydrogenase
MDRDCFVAQGVPRNDSAYLAKICSSGASLAIMKRQVRDAALRPASRSVADLQYGAVLSPHAELRAGDYSDLEGAALVMITAGANEKTAALPIGTTLRAG